MKRLALVLALILGPVAVVSPVEASKPWLCPKYTAQIKKTFPRKDWRTMDRIMWRESNAKHVLSGGITALAPPTEIAGITAFTMPAKNARPLNRGM
jgi:hypothetical protein